MSVKSELKNFFTDHWKYMAVSAACKLNLFDEVKQGFNPGEIAERNQWDLKQLTVLFDALSEIEFLIKTENGFQLNERSELLTEDHEDSLKYASQVWSSDHLTSWQKLPDLIKTGKSPFFGEKSQSYFRYLEDNPEKLSEYHCAMYEYARDDYKNICEKINFNEHKSILDVGGGFGALIKEVKVKHPKISCHLLDLEQVIIQCKIKDIHLHEGDFFKSIPEVADTILLSRILHDWNDERASVILKNCFASLPKKGKLYIIENCTDELTSNLPLLSLNMGLMCDSFERTTKQFDYLAKSAGFTLIAKTPLNDLQTILTFEK